MQAERRFIPDGELIEACVHLVEEQGGDEFFAQGDWRQRLKKAVQDHERTKGRLGRFQSADERDDDVLEELVASRRAIEQNLPGSTVDHLCFPWFEGLPFATDAARKAGYQVAYVGLRARRPTNRPGQDPMGVVRVDELYLERLPGEGRKSLLDLGKRMVSDRSIPNRLFPAGKVTPPSNPGPLP
jgi:hypothetical protein